MIISQVVPFPWDASIPVVAQYALALKAVNAEAQPGFVSLEGYMVGRLAIEGLEAAGADLMRESCLAAMNALTSVDLGGITMTYGAGDNQGMEDVFLTRINKDGGFDPIVSGDNS